VYAGSEAGGTVIQSLIPSTVSASYRYLVLAPAGGSEGLVMKASGGVALDGGSVSEKGYLATAEYKGKRYDFDFWKARIGVGIAPANDWSTDSIDKPIYNADKKFYYIKPVSGEVDLASDWSVASGDKPNLLCRISLVCKIWNEARIQSDAHRCRS